MTPNSTSGDETDGRAQLPALYGHNSEQSGERIESVDEAPVCPGCGLMSHVERHGGICRECWERGRRRSGGGPLRIVTTGDTYHETSLCPGVRAASGWWYQRDEDTMHLDIAGHIDKCVRCHSFRMWGFDHYRGEDKTVIGHA